MKFFKDKNKILLILTYTVVLFLGYSCVDNESSVYGIEDEPNAIIGFPENEATIVEGNKALKLQINTSKFLFNDATFDLIVVSGDANGITFTDIDGKEGTSFTIEKGAKTINLDVNVINDDKYLGNRIVTFALGNLVGEGVFIPEDNIGSSERRLNIQFELTVQDDEPVPPSVGFNALNGKVDENATQPFKAIIELTTPALKAGSFDVNFSGTAIADTDYTSNAVNNILPINFAIGTKLIEIEITPIDNTIIDGDKTVVLTIDNLSEGFFLGEVPEYVLTIVGDDLPIKETTIIAEADAWTRGRNGSGKSDDNGGAKTDLVASDGNSDNDLREFYLKFDLTGIDPSKVTEAKIVLTTTRESNWANAETNFGGATTQTLYHVTDDSWGEMTITANTKPASDASPIATFTSDFLIGSTTLSNLAHEFNVTAQIQVESDGKLSVRLNTVNTLGQRIFYASREHVNNTPPKLVIVESL